jgi:bifunctional enzyme CysN/CysC
MSQRIGALLQKVTLDHLAVIPASALAGDNIVRRSERMGWYEGPTVIGALDLLAPDVADESLPLRLPVQDVYEVDGEELAVGRLASGTVEAGQKVQVCPTGQVGEIGVLRKFEGPVAAASAGESIGFALADGGRLRRGQTLCPPEDLPAVSGSVAARVFWMAEAPLRRGEGVAVRLATQEVPCTVQRIAGRTDSGSLEVLAGESAELANTEVAEVTLAAQEPVHYDRFGKVAEMGRLVLMRGADIVAGGILP